MEFQQQRFYKPDEPNAAQSSDEHQGDEGEDEVKEIKKVQDEASTSRTLTPLDALNPRHCKRRTDALLALLKEEAEEQKITTTQLLGYMLHRENYVHDRPVASVGLKLFQKEKVSLDEALFMLSSYKLGRT